VPYTVGDPTNMNADGPGMPADGFLFFHDTP